jgi:hypothetical protein
MSGTSSSSARTAGSNSVNDVGPGARTYLGGMSECTALITVVREIPSRSAIRAFGTPSAASLLISAQSFQNDHSPIVECSLFTAETVQFSSAADIDVSSACGVSGGWLDITFTP